MAVFKSVLIWSPHRPRSTYEARAIRQRTSIIRMCTLGYKSSGVYRSCDKVGNVAVSNPHGCCDRLVRELRTLSCPSAYSLSSTRSSNVAFPFKHRPLALRHYRRKQGLEIPLAFANLPAPDAQMPLPVRPSVAAARSVHLLLHHTTVIRGSKRFRR